MPPLALRRFLRYIECMTMTQTVEISADRRVRFDFEVPREVPEGKMVVVIQFPNRAEVSARRELTAEEAAQYKVMPTQKMTAEEEAEYLRKNTEWLNREAMDALEDQVDMFADPRGEL